MTIVGCESRTGLREREDNGGAVAFQPHGSNTYEQVYGGAALANIPAIMPPYNLFVCNQHNRIRYPKNFALPDVEAARAAALRVAKVFM